MDTHVGVINSGQMGDKQLTYTGMINSGHMGWQIADAAVSNSQHLSHVINSWVGVINSGHVRSLTIPTYTGDTQSTHVYRDTQRSKCRSYTLDTHWDMCVWGVHTHLLLSAR